MGRARSLSGQAVCRLPEPGGEQTAKRIKGIYMLLIGPAGMNRIFRKFPKRKSHAMRINLMLGTTKAGLAPLQRTVPVLIKGLIFYSSIIMESVATLTSTCPHFGKETQVQI